MAKNYKYSFKLYSSWNYENELEDLNKYSERGWQLVKDGMFHRKFVKNENIRYRYQMDFRRIEDKVRYIETFREQGWDTLILTLMSVIFFVRYMILLCPKRNMKYSQIVSLFMK